jgi:hypothetical protein
MYLVLVFLGWLFLEGKNHLWSGERFFERQSIWFYALSSFFFTAVIYASVSSGHQFLALAASIGTTAFFLTDGFKKNAEAKEQELLHRPGLSDWSKIIYLEFLDASFSIDGVIGAFAFTTSIPLILIGNGIGALVVRQLTISGIDTIARFHYLKNGAMYSIGILGGIMVWEAFGHHLPFWLAPVSTLVLLGFTLLIRRAPQSSSLPPAATA